MNWGTGENGSVTFLDVISLVGFLVGIANLDQNITQNDVQRTVDRMLTEIHAHLEEQDEKLERILQNGDYKKAF